MTEIDVLGYRELMMTPAQSRAARGLLGWTQAELANAARVGVVTVRQFEGGNAEPRSATLTVMRQALEAAGILFISEDTHGFGVRLQRTERFELDLTSLIQLYGLDGETSLAEVIVDHCSDEERHALAQAFGDRLWGRKNRPNDKRGREIQDRITRTGEFRS